MIGGELYVTGGVTTRQVSSKIAGGFVCAVWLCVGGQRRRYKTKNTQKGHSHTEREQSRGAIPAGIDVAQAPGVDSRGRNLQQSTSAPLCATVSEVGERRQNEREKDLERYLKEREKYLRGRYLDDRQRAKREKRG